MILLEIVVLWAAGVIALAMIMAYVLKTPQSQQRPELGLGKRFSVGPVEYGKRRSRNRHERETSPVLQEQPVQKQASPVRQIAVPAQQAPGQTFSAQPVQEYQALPETQSPSASPDEISGQEKRRTKKRTDTLQFMLDKAISERR